MKHIRWLFPTNSIAALPFQNLSGDPEQEYLADGVVEDIITASAASRSPAVPAPANRASIFRNFSRNWDSVDIDRLAVEFEKPNIRPRRGQPPGHRYPRHSLAVGSNDRYR
jgi:hypothetical protein